LGNTLKTTLKQYLLKGVPEMLNQYFVVAVLANEHRNYLLKEANADRVVRQVKMNRSVLANHIKRMGARFDGLRIGAVRPVADQASLFTDGAITAGHR
jgi:hypothetical protein